ncbi:MAG TPA: DNA recombination protein RmuC [Mycobacteriales bacterium]|nr:DNA recombination protein RmuC [Mycobacteriales bacterium]
MDVAAVVIAVLTLFAGAIAGWALARSRYAGAAATAAAERDAARAEAQQVRAERDEQLARVRAERDEQLGQIRAERDEQAAQLRAERDELAGQLRAAEAAGADAAARLESERAAATEKLALLEQAQAQLKDAFARLSNEALQRSNAQFLDLADARFKQAGAPLTETLTKVESQLREIEKERAGAHEALKSQIEFVRRTGEDLKQETAALVSALRKPQARGRWGELQLRRCVEYAGMTDRCDFTEQTTVATSDGALRPDLVVKLVGGKSIVVDSKVTLSAYLEAHDAGDDDVREARLAAHARHLRTHVDQLAAKSYWSQFSPAPEFVVLFVPGDAFLAPALERDPTLLDEAFAKRVHIATPTTLISVLRTCAYAWQQEALAANAREVFDLGRELYKRLGTLGDHVDKLGRSLTSAVKAYNGTVGSLERQVLVTARKLNDLQVVDAELDSPTAVEESVRPLGAAELVTAAEQSRTVVALPAAGAGVDADAVEVVELDRIDDYGLGDPGSATDTRATG